MTKLLAALLALALVALLPAAAADAKRRPDACRVAQDGHAVRKTRRVLVTYRDQAVFACMRPNGRRYYLGDDDGVYTSVSINAIVGASVTYTVNYTPECKADCPPDVTGSMTMHTIDLRTGKITDA